jgi:hypothetical protein
MVLAVQVWGLSGALSLGSSVRAVSRAQSTCVRHPRRRAGFQRF